MTHTATSYEDILLKYNWTGNGNYLDDQGNSVSTVQLPTTGLTAVNGQYTVGYNFLIDQNSLDLAGYYDTPLNDVDSDGSYDAEYDYFRASTAVQQDALKIIMHEASGYDYTYSAFFTDVANINFATETPQNAEILIAQNDGANGVFPSNFNPAYVTDYVPSGAQTVEKKYADMWINEDLSAGWASADEGSAQFWSLLHETGHTLGLADFLTQAEIDSALNSQKFTVMSYNLMDGMDVSGSSGDVYASSLQLLDIAAIQAVYGADTTTRLGDTTYKEGQGFASNVSDAFIYTIWDAGGAADTIDASSYTDGVYIDLNEGAFSSIGKAANSSFVSDRNGDGVNETGLAKDNVAIAYGAEIENATGTDSNDTLIGNDLNNHLIGGWGVDHLYGGAGNDTLDGGVHGDFYYFQLGGWIDTITETWSGNNKIVFDSNVNFADVTTSISGNDIIYSHVDGTQMILKDYLIKTGGSVSVTYDAAVNTGDNSQEQFIFVGNDAPSQTIRFHGNVAPEIYSMIAFGKGGNDLIIGSNNNDTLYGDQGNDDLRSYFGSDKLYGGTGEDKIALRTLEGQVSYVYGGDDNDRVTFDFVRGTVYAEDTDGDDIYNGSVVNSTVNSAVFITDTDGNDTYQVGGPNVSIEDTAGDDYYQIRGTNFSLKDTGGTDHAYLRFEHYNYDGFTQSGNDLQIFFYNYTTQITFEDYFLGANHQIETISFFDLGTVNFDYLFNPSNHIFGTSAPNANLNGTANDDTIYGFEGDDTLNGNLGNDVLYGGEDDDILIGGDGDDTLDGGSGIDTASYASSAAAVTINLQAGVTDEAQDGSNDDTLVSIENAIGSAFADQIYADNTDNVIDGLAGNDALYGYGGNDTFQSGTGVDYINGGTGIDTLTYASASNGIVVDLNIFSATNDGDGATDTIVNVENIIGSAFGDTIQGDNSDNRLEGGDGDDFIYGLGGSDQIYGNDGNDYLKGDDDVDYIYGGTGNDQLFGGGGDDHLYGEDGMDILTGVADNDTLYGGNDADTLYGYLGDDHLYGGDGADTLYGDAGADVFHFEAGETGTDTVADFNVGHGDALDISDILSGNYNSTTDDITDFVQITDNGISSTVAIDADGAANGSSFTTIATLLNATGLTDEALLETNGTLITA